MVRSKDDIEGKPEVPQGAVAPGGVKGTKDKQKTKSAQPAAGKKKAAEARSKKSKAEIVGTNEGPQLTEAQLEAFTDLRAQILRAKRNKGLEFYLQVGKILVDGLGEAVAEDDPVLKALAKDEDVQISKSNLWYCVQLQEPEKLFGSAASALQGSHLRRLLHAPQDKRHELAALAVSEKLTVQQLEERIKGVRVRKPDEKVRGVKPLPIAAKRFSVLAAAATKIGDANAAELSGLDEKKAKAMYANVQALKKLVDEWLPDFEAELAKIARIGA